MTLKIETTADGQTATLRLISGPMGAAAKLGVPRQTLESKIKALQIDKLAFRRR